MEVFQVPGSSMDVSAGARLFRERNFPKVLRLKLTNLPTPDSLLMATAIMGPCQSYVAPTLSLTSTKAP